MYMDTSVLLKLYKNEDFSREIQDFIREIDEPVLLTPLHELEFNNALMLNQFHQNIDDITTREITNWFRQDIRDGVYRRVVIDYVTVISKAIKLSSKWTPRIASRPFDVLHIATALEIKQEMIISFDQQQLRLGELAGLKTKTWN